MNNEKMMQSSCGDSKEILIEKYLSTVFTNIQKKQSAIEEDLVTLKEYFDTYADTENILLETGGSGGGSGTGTGNGSTGRMTPKPVITPQIGELLSSIAQSIGNVTAPRSSQQLQYQPAPGIQITTDFRNMTFPKNIVFILERIIMWLKDIVLYAIVQLKSLLRFVVTGEKNSFDDLDEMKKKLKISFQKVKAIQAQGLPVNYGGSVDPTTGALKDKIIRAYSLPKDYEFKPLGEQTLFEFNGDPMVREKVVVISTDVSNDLIAVKELCQHFFDLFDNAFGSNEEFLFGTQDVELLMTGFKSMLTTLKDGNVTMYTFGGNVGEIDAIDADRLKDSLIKTNINVTALSKAYQQTYAKIQDILKVIQSKAMLTSTDFGVAYKFLSMETTNKLSKIIDAINPRLKDAKKLEVKLDKMEKMYNKLVADLSKLSNVIGAYGKVTYVSEYQKRVKNLFDGARYVSQTIALRISALGLYIKELNDLKSMIKIMTNFK